LTFSKPGSENEIKLLAKTYERGDNLCHLVRTFFYGALALASQLLVIGVAFWCFAWEPFGWYGASYVHAVFWTVAGVLTFLFLAWLAKILLEEIDDLTPEKKSRKDKSNLSTSVSWQKPTQIHVYML
jgi:hypothetical protein